VGTNGGPKNKVVGESSGGEGGWPIGWQYALAKHGSNQYGDSDWCWKGLWSGRLKGGWAWARVGREGSHGRSVACVVWLARAGGQWEAGRLRVSRWRARCWWPADGGWAGQGVFWSKQGQRSSI